MLDPIVARLFVDLGFDTKEKLIEWCAENAQDAGARLLGRSVGADAHASARGRRRRAVRQQAQGQPRRDGELFEPQDINIVVAGGETQGAWKMIGGAYRGKATVSVDAWR